MALPDYIMETTHPDNPSRQDDLKAWRKELLDFSNHTRFVLLEINEFIDGDQQAFVTFTANLHQSGEALAFTEKSTFEKSGERWMYRDGTLEQRVD